MKMICLFLSVIAIMSLFSCGSSGTSANTPASSDGATYSSGATQNNTRGHDIFVERCQPCHGLSGSYRGNNAANLRVSVLDSISIVATIKNGRNNMPMFKTIFNDTDLSQLELYVKTLRK